MSEEYGADFITISDDDGKEYLLEHIDTVEMDGEVYAAFVPADISEDDENYGIVILKCEEGEDGENYFVNVSEEVEEKVYDLVMERAFSEDGEDEQE